MSKFEKLVHYACHKRRLKPNSLGATKLNKVLWFADSIHFLHTGKSLTGSGYVKRQFGPVPDKILATLRSLEAKGLVQQRDVDYMGLRKREFHTNVEPDISNFTAVQISLIDEVIEAVCDSHTAASISAHTHDIIWEAAELGEKIPLVAILASQPGSPTKEDMTWANQVVKGRNA